jgi:flagellar basal-body rod protein FlgB
MDLRKLPIFAMMSKRMAWLAQRQQVLAQNIANADTPGYRPRDLKPLGFKELARSSLASLRPKVTHAAHIATASGARETGFPQTVQKESVETTLSGNAVVLEEQLMKASQTAMDYETTTNLYRKHISMIKDALGRNE